MRTVDKLELAQRRARNFADSEQAAWVIFANRGDYDYARLDWYLEQNSPGELIDIIRPRYRYMEDVKRRNAKLGNHWFEPSTLRFFGSRVHDSLYTAGDRAYFVTSEKPPHGRRAYSVRRANPDGSIDTVGEFCGFNTGRQAHARAAWIAEHGENGEGE